MCIFCIFGVAYFFGRFICGYLLYIKNNKYNNQRRKAMLEEVEKLPSELKILIFGFIDIDTRILLWNHRHKDLRIMIESLLNRGRMIKTLEIFNRYFPPKELSKIALYSIAKVGVFNNVMLFRLDNVFVDKLLDRVKQLETVTMGETTYHQKRNIFKMLTAYTCYYNHIFLDGE